MCAWMGVTREVFWRKQKLDMINKRALCLTGQQRPHRTICSDSDKFTLFSECVDARACACSFVQVHYVLAKDIQVLQ